MQLISKTFFIACILTMAFTYSAHCAEEEWLDHTAYTITTYSFDPFTVDGENSLHSEKPFLLITGFHSDLFSGEYIPGTETDYFDSPQNSAKSFIVSGKFDATENLAITGTLGFIQNEWDSSFFNDENESWEANIGVIYKLFGNLSYGFHFGYMETGDTFKERSYDSTESIMMISNQISLSF